MKQCITEGCETDIEAKYGKLAPLIKKCTDCRTKKMQLTCTTPSAKGGWSVNPLPEFV